MKNKCLHLFLLFLAAQCFVACTKRNLEEEWSRLKNDGLDAFSAGNTSEAAKQFRSELQVAEEAKRPDLIASSYADLAMVAEDEDKLDDALKYHQRGLQTLEKQNPPDAPAIIGSLEQIIGIYDLLGRGSETRPIFQRILELQEKTFGPKDRSLVDTLLNLAQQWREDGGIAEAERLGERAEAIAEQYCEKEEPVCLVSYVRNNLIRLYVEKGDLDKALSCLKKIPAEEQEMDAIDPLAKGLQKANRIGDAEPLLTRVAQLLSEAEKASESENFEMSGDAE